MRCMAVAFLPPYSSGQPTAAHRPPLSSRCQAARRCWDFSPDREESSASSSLARKGGRYSSSHARSSSRKASSSGARAKSTGQDASRGAVTLLTPASDIYTGANFVDATPGVDCGFHVRCRTTRLTGRGPSGHGRGGGRQLRQLADDPSGVTPELWDQLVALGWTGMLVPGEGAGLLEMCIILEQMGRVPLPGPFFSSAVMATLAARALGADGLLEGLASGAQRGTVALQEQGHGHPLTTVRARARRKGSGWVLTGLKPTVVDGHTADWAIVVALAEEGIRSFLLPAPKAEPVPGLDPTRKLSRLVLDEEPVEPLGPGGIRRCCGARSSTTSPWPWPPSWWACRTGPSGRLSSMPRGGWSSTGRSPNSKSSSTGSSTCTTPWRWRGPGCTSPPGPRTPMGPSGPGPPPWPRAYAAEAAVKVTGDDIQLHGGVGFTWANDAHFLFKRAKQNEVLMGGTGHQWHSLAGMLVEPA